MNDCNPMFGDNLYSGEVHENETSSLTHREFVTIVNFRFNILCKFEFHAVLDVFKYR